MVVAQNLGLDQIFPLLGRNQLAGPGILFLTFSAFEPLLLAPFLH